MTIDIRHTIPGDFEQIYSLIREFADFIKTPEKVTTTPAQMMEDKDHFK